MDLEQCTEIRRKMMEEICRLVNRIKLSDEIKEKLIKKEYERRLPECEKIINEALQSRFKELTEEMWVKIDNKDVYYVNSDKYDKKKEIEILVADTLRMPCFKASQEKFPKKMNGYKCRVLYDDEVDYLFYSRRDELPLIMKKDRIVFFNNVPESVKKKAKETSLKDILHLYDELEEYSVSKHISYVRRNDNSKRFARTHEKSIYSSSGSESGWDMKTVMLPAADVDKGQNKLETFLKNDLIPQGFSKKEEELFKSCLALYSKGHLVFTENGRMNLVGEGFELAGISLRKQDIEKSIFNSTVELSEEMEQIIYENYLNCDYRRAGIDKYDRKLLEDAGRGHWELWRAEKGAKNIIQISRPLEGRNPLADIHRDGVIGIDFGTKSTVIVCQDGTAHMHPMRIGSGNYKMEVRGTDYENPTVMQFVHLEHFLETYQAKEGRPETLWEDVNISHTAAEALKTAASSEYYSYFSDLKQWCGDRSRHVRIRDRDNSERTLPAFVELKKGEFNPIEIYAYYLGLFINNMHQGIFLDYILSFPVTYEKAVRDKIVQSFYTGLKKSLPIEVQQVKEAMQQFRVTSGASEPAAYAACALKEYNFDPQEGEKFLYGIFDFGGGTTDFDFGLWRAPEDKKEARRYDYVIEHFGASGDQYLGGENLLELLAFSIFKKNQSALREAEITFTRPNGCESFPGSEALLKNSQEAKLNMKQVMEAVRGLWEHNNQEQIKNIESGSIKVQLFTNKGERVQNFELKVEKKELEQILRERIREGVDNFFDALKLTFDRNDVEQCNSVNIFLAGNSSKSPVVWELFEEKMAERTKELQDMLKAQKRSIDEEHQFYRIFPPLGTTEEDIKGQKESADKEAKKRKPARNTPSIGAREEKLLKPTGKTGVAYGLLLCRKGGKIKDVPEKQKDDEAKFRYYLGSEIKGRFHVEISTTVAYGEWIEFIDASEDRFDIYYSSSPSVTTNKLSIEAGSVFLKKCTIQKENEDANVYIRAVAPSVIEYAVATEDGIKSDKFIEAPVRVDLG